MDLAHVDELTKDNNGLKYLPFRQDLFDTTVDAKRRKKRFQRTVRAFLTRITKNNPPIEIEWTKDQNMQETLKNHEMLKEYEVILQWVRLKLHLLSIQCDPWKKILYRWKEDFGNK